MGYKVKVVGENSQIDWKRFIRETGLYTKCDYITPLDDLLKPYGAKNLNGTNYIEFEDETQAMIFIAERKTAGSLVPQM